MPAQVPFAIKGDWDHVAKAFGLQHYSGNQPCDHCRCNKAGPQSLWPNNFLPDAGWKQQMITPEQWRAANPNPHWLFQAFPYLSNANVEPDELHVVFLGTSMHLLGSVLWLLVYRLLPNSPADNMNRIWSDIAELYRERRTPAQYSNIELKSFIDPAQPRAAYPKLKGKGAEIKHLAPILLEIWRRHQRPGNDRDAWVLECLEHQCALQSIADESPHDLFLSDAQAATFRSTLDGYLRMYSRLAAAADAAGDLLFTVAPKHHLYWHLGQRAGWLHPRRGACFLDEDFVRRIKGIVEACTVHRLNAPA